MINTLFFYASKIAWILVSPANLLYLLILTGTVLLFLQQLRLARMLLGTGLILLTLAAFLPLGKWIGTPLETRFAANPDLPQRIDGIILLGGAVNPLNSYIWDQAEIGAAADRYLAFVTLAREYPQAKLVFTGGTGAILDQEYKEADIALYLLESLGIEPDRLELERDSRNTFENALYSKPLMNPAANENWILVTSAAHMPRAVGIFCAQDWPVIAYPVDHRTSPGKQLRIGLNLADNLDSLNQTTREWMGLLAYRLTGKTSALLPSGCR